MHITNCICKISGRNSTAWRGQWVLSSFNIKEQTDEVYKLDTWLFENILQCQVMDHLNRCPQKEPSLYSEKDTCLFLGWISSCPTFLIEECKSRTTTTKKFRESWLIWKQKSVFLKPDFIGYISGYFCTPLLSVFRMGMELWKKSTGLETMMERRGLLDAEKSIEADWYCIIFVSDGFCWSAHFLFPYDTCTLIYKHTHMDTSI